MRILAFSDLHGDEAALDSLRSIARSDRYDRVFICGDITKHVVFAESVAEAFPNGLIVPGNWDSGPVNDFLSTTAQWIHEKRVELPEGLNAVGFGYSPPTPFRTHGELTENDIHSRMSKLAIDPNTLLLLHCPPKGHFDEGFLGRHIGSESILRVIQEKKPLAAFFGHAHEQEGVSQLGPTTLVKLPPANIMRACSVEVRDKRIGVKFLSL